MSTPSTATATLPPHNHQYYPRHHALGPQVSAYGSIVNSASKVLPPPPPPPPISRINPLHPLPPPPPPPPPHSASSSSSASASIASTNTPDRRTLAERESVRLPPPAPAASPPHHLSEAMNSSSRSKITRSTKSSRKPNWEEFYKNGVPKEVIVIDDDTPEPQRSKKGDDRPDKKRKLGVASTYDPVYNPQPSYSTTHTPYYDNSSANHTVSTDRTAPMYQGTGSSSIGPSVNGHYGLEEGVVGQKRKRIVRPVEDAKVAKRRELARHPQSPFSAYIPPPKPPIKARDVFVKVVKDVSSRLSISRTTAHRKKPTGARDPKAFDDEDGHYMVEPDSDLTPRYKIVKLLGQGTFGKVVEAWDRDSNTKCAVKVIRSVQKYRDASRIELRVLATLKQNDTQNRNKCIHLRDCFDFRNHICIVTDLYGTSVFDFLKGNSFTPFPSSHIQLFARQLLTSVAFLHDLNLIHTDLKPENILLVDNTYQTFTYNRTVPSSSTTQNRTARHRKVLLNPEIRLIDFGSATFDDEYHSSVVSTRHYRAPEIILNLGWSFPCDMWSIGCILVEFFTGDALFQTHDNLEHLAMMEPVCNYKIDREIITRVMSKERSSKNPAANYFTRTKRLDYPNNETPRNSKKYVKAMKRLDETIPPASEFNRQFLDLLRRIFVYDPDQRITAKQALKHPWFKEVSIDDGTEAAKIREEQKTKKRSTAEAERRAHGYA